MEFERILVVIAAVVFIIAALIVIIQRIQQQGLPGAAAAVNDLRANEQWMNTVEKAITETVHKDVLLAAMQVINSASNTFNTLNTLLLSNNPDVAKLIAAGKDLGTGLIDNQPWTPPTGGSINSYTWNVPGGQVKGTAPANSIAASPAEPDAVG